MNRIHGHSDSVRRPGVLVPSETRSPLEPNRPPLKVLFLSACTGRGGAGNSLYYICKYLDRALIEPLVVLPNEGVIGSKLQALGISTVFAPRLRERFHELRLSRANPLTMALSYVLNAWDSVLFTLQLARMARRRRIDVIHCNHMMVKVMGVVAGALAGCSVVLHTRTIYGTPVERYLYLSFARLPHVRRIVAVSEAAAANFGELSEKVRVIHNGVPLDELEPSRNPGFLARELGLEPGTRIVGFVGRLVEWKGIDVFFRAAEILSKLRDDVVFVVVGDVPVGSTHRTLEGYRRDVRDRGLTETVVFTGFRKDAHDLIRELDVLVVPSIRPDPCPRVVLEGLAMGTPVVGSASGGIAETIRDGRTGLLVEPGNPRDLVRQLQRILQDRDLAEGISRQARAEARERFSAEGVSRRVQDVLLEAGGGASPRGTPGRNP